MLVCGVDVGSLRTLSYVAWLQERDFLLDLYIPSAEHPLPRSPQGLDPPRFIGFDVPQGLAAIGSRTRVADVAANTPTRRLPAGRDELVQWKLYKGLIEAGVEMFWSIHSRRLASIVGLEAIVEAPTTVFETYPRYIIKRLWPGTVIPSKKAAPLVYVDAIWGRIQAAGYTCRGVARPGVDHVDAMVCALAAEACLATEAWPSGTVGNAPTVDYAGHVIRDGYIVSP